MQPPKIPEEEAERLNILRDLLILDTPPEERFDTITHFCATRFEVPIALISLVDAQRQWFKSACGLETKETPRAISFCGHAILENSILVIENALDDIRFANNPLVTGEPFIRFYAGVPLNIRGKNIGTLCLIDATPRRFDAYDRRTLKELSLLVVEELEKNLK